MIITFLLIENIWFPSKYKCLSCLKLLNVLGLIRVSKLKESTRSWRSARFANASIPIMLSWFESKNSVSKRSNPLKPI